MRRLLTLWRCQLQEYIWWHVATAFLVLVFVSCGLSQAFGLEELEAVFGEFCFWVALRGLLRELWCFALLLLCMVHFLGTPVALCAAYRPGKMFDQIGRVLSILAICVPTFWLSYMLLVIFAVKIPLITVVPRPGLEGLLMPSLALAIPSAGSYVRVFRASLLRQMGSEYCLVARTRG